MPDRLDLSAIQWDQPAVPAQQTPAFRGAVTASETRARGTFQDTTRKGPNGKPIFGQVNTVTGEFRPYPKEMQPTPPAAPISAVEQAKARADAAKRIQLARQLRENTSGLTGTGAFGPLFASLPIGATRAKDAEAIINSLEKKGAMSAVLDMLKRTGGKNPFTPMSQDKIMQTHEQRPFVNLAFNSLHLGASQLRSQPFELSTPVLQGHFGSLPPRKPV